MIKKIKGLEEYGAIDEYGNVFSHRTKKKRKCYYDTSKQKCISVDGATHRIKNLVALTFIGEWDRDKEEIVYIDGNKANTHYKNLRISPKQTRYKLTQDEANLIKVKYQAGHRKSALAKAYGVSVTTICKIIKGNLWK